MAHMYLDESIDDCQIGNVFDLVGDEARHAATVSRLRVGESVLLGNGRGMIAQTETLAVSKSSVQLRAMAVDRCQQDPIPVVLVQALAKGDRDERAIEAATELGVTTIVPWFAARSISRWDGEKVVKGRSRWQSVAREATKQSLRAWLPEVTPPEGLVQLVQRVQTSTTLVLDPTATTTLTAACELAKPNSVTLVVGPEGGIAPDELVALEQVGAVRVRLGRNILRTSTAGPAALAAINEILHRW